MSHSLAPPIVAVYNTEDQVCFLCGETRGLSRCEDCATIWVCSPDHLEVHRHKGRCFPFIIKRSPTKGRFMVATRDIEALEMILWEQPAVIGPYTREAQGCLQCFQKVSSPYTCQRCNLPVCDAKCQDGTLHKDNECQFFQAGVTEGGQARGTGTVPSQICVTPLRMLLKRARDPKVFAQIDMLMDHATNGKDLLTLSTLKVICMIRDQRQGTNFAQSEIQRMIGILRTNGMKLEQRGEDGTPGVALYPIYSLINHACSNNTNYVKYSDRHMELRSQVAIGKGQEIFTRYISSTLGNVRRREEIERNWFFRCQCPRCLDPTEFGTFMSAVRCFQCQSGYLLPSDAQDLESDWKCDRCEWIILHQKVNEVITTLETQFQEDTERTVESLEEMLFHFQKVLHPNHYIAIDIMHSLVHIYAEKETLTRPEKERKIQLCHFVLDTLTQVDGGYTKWRGILLHEMIHPLVMISREDHSHGRISDREYQRRLNFCGRKVKEARLCLYGGFTPIDEYLSEGTGEDTHMDDS